MLHTLYVLEVYLKIVFNWTTFRHWFLKLIFETCQIMSFKVFSRKLAQRNRIWCFKCWVLCLETNLEIPYFGSTREQGTSRSCVLSEFMQSTPASKVTLEREMHVSSTLHVFTVRSSEGMHSRARTCVSRSSEGRAPVEREFHASSTFTVCSSEKSHARAELLCLHVRSSIESHARARPLFSENSEKCF